MSSAIQNIMQKSLGDGARATKFEVMIDFSNSSVFNPEDAATLVKTVSFPGKSHTTIDFKYKGRSVPIKGQTKYTQTWECTFYLTQDHRLKYAFENWIEALDQKHNYLKYENDPNLAITQDKHSVIGYTKDIKLYQLNFDADEETARYQLFNAFPIEVTPIQYDYSAVGTVQEFTVTFAYSHFSMEVMKGKDGNFIDEIAGSILEASKNSINNAVSSIGESINNFVKDNVNDSLDKLKGNLSNFNNNSKGGNTNTASNLINGGIGPYDMERKVGD